MSSISKYKMKDGRIITVDYMSIESLQSVNKEDWKEIRQQNDLALKVINSDLFVINFLKSVGQLPSKQDYEDAKNIVALYEGVKKREAKVKSELMYNEIHEIFGNSIKEFELYVEHTGDLYTVIVCPTEPSFSEDYGGEFDSQLEELGKKYELFVKMEPGIYGK